MAWECAECVRERMSVVCHHCGKPLCEEHAVVVEDDALSDREGPVSDKAAHCEDCQKQHHPRLQLVVKPQFAERIAR